jgi:ammonia channel protein AmtB
MSHYTSLLQGRFASTSPSLSRVILVRSKSFLPPRLMIVRWRKMLEQNHLLTGSTACHISSGMAAMVTATIFFREKISPSLLCN